MFAKPRPKRGVLIPPPKKRKTTSAVEEVAFDNDARHDFLTGFHKRKQQRVKNAQEQAAVRARQEKIEARKQLRQERRREVEEHVETVNRMLQESQSAGMDLSPDDDEDDAADEWQGIPDQADAQRIEEHEEYIDEDRFTTVTIESVSVSRDGFEKPEHHDSGDEKGGEDVVIGREDPAESAAHAQPQRRPRKKKFRYESKIDRQLADRRQRAKKKSKRPT